MSAQVLELLLLVFKDEKSAAEGLKELKQAQKDGDIEIIDAAVLEKNEKGKVHYKEVADMKLRKKGRWIGGAAGATLALIGGPAGLLVATAAGAVTGGLVTRLKDKGIPNDELKEMANALDSNSSALIALVDHVWVQKVIDEAVEYTAEVVRQELESEAQAVIVTAMEEETSEVEASNEKV